MGTETKSSVCGWMFATDLLILSPQSAAAAPSPVLGNIPPNDGMPGGPIPPGFFQVRSGLGPCAGQAGRRGQERSLVCHGLNSCFVLVEALLSHLVHFSKSCRGEESAGKVSPSRRAVVVSFCPPCCRERPVLPGQCGVVFFFFLYNKSCILCLPRFLLSKLSFVSVLLLLSSLLFTFPVQTTNLGVTKKTEPPASWRASASFHFG